MTDKKETEVRPEEPDLSEAELTDAEELAIEIEEADTLSMEEHLRHAESVAEMAGRMKRYDYRDSYFRKALREVKPFVEESEEAKKLFRWLRRKMHSARARYRISAYRRACRIRDGAKNAADLEYAAEQFEAVDAYDKKHHLNPKFTRADLYEKAQACTDSLEQAAACRARQRAVERRRRLAATGVLAVLLVLLAGAGLFWRTAPFLKLKGDAEAALGFHGKAWQAYEQSFLRSGDASLHEKALASRYAYAVSQTEKGQDEKVRADLAALAKEGYLDSGARYAEAERRLMTGKQPGEKVTFGEVKWTVLEQKGERMLLLKTEIIPRIAFQEGGGSCTWADSTLRAYLNGAYLDERFPAEEQAMLAETEIPAEDNRLNGLSGGEATRDRVFLLSASEAEHYAQLLGETERCWWLRTPGTEPGTMAFVDTDKTVMDYGYLSSADSIRVRPAIWVELAGS